MTTWPPLKRWMQFSAGFAVDRHERRLGLCGAAGCKQIQITVPTDRKSGCTSAKLLGTNWHKTLDTPV